MAAATASLSDKELSKIIENKAGAIASLSLGSRIDTRQAIIDEINRFIDERVRNFQNP